MTRYRSAALSRFEDRQDRGSRASLVQPGVNAAIDFIHTAAEQPKRTPAPEIVTIDSKEHGKVDVQMYPEPGMWVKCRVGRAFTATPEMREVKLSMMDEGQAIGAYNRARTAEYDEEQEDQTEPCTDPDGHSWRNVGEAKDGTNCYECRNCPAEWHD